MGLFDGPKFKRKGESYPGHAAEVLSKGVVEEVDRLTDEQICSESAADLAERLVANHFFTLPEIKWSETTIEVHEVQETMPYTRPEHTQIRYYVPFEGNGLILTLQPSTKDKQYGASRIEGNSIVFTYEARDNNPAAIKRLFEQEMASIKDVLQALKYDLENYNKSLKRDVVQSIQKRKILITKPDWEKELGYPKRTK